MLVLVRLAVAPNFPNRNNTCRANYVYKGVGIRMPSRTSICCSPARGGRRMLAKRYIFQQIRACLPEMKHFSNGFNFLLEADFFNFDPFMVVNTACCSYMDFFIIFFFLHFVNVINNTQNRNIDAFKVTVIPLITVGYKSIINTSIVN